MFSLTQNMMKENERTGLLPKWHELDFLYLEVKLHYALLFGGAASSIPFMPLLAKEVGIQATHIGAIVTTSALLSFLLPPTFGILSDYIKNTKRILIGLVILATVSSFSLQYIPVISIQQDTYNVILTCSEREFSIQPTSYYNNTCLHAILYQRKKKCYHSEQLDANDHEEVFSKLLCGTNASEIITLELPKFPNNSHYDNCLTIRWHGCQESTWYSTDCDPSIAHCFNKDKQDSIGIYGMYQFWTFAVLAVISSTFVNVCYFLSDALCFEILKEKSEFFGQQRLWSLFSFGLFNFVAAELNDINSKSTGKSNYSLGYYMMLILWILDMIVLVRLTNVKISLDHFTFKSLSLMFSSAKILGVAILSFINGILLSFTWSFHFLFLKDLGATETLLGVTMLVQNLLGDIPIFIASRKLIQIFGHFFCFIICFSGSALRHFLYFIIKNPWYMVPVEILDGLAFSLYLTTMMSFANKYAEPGAVSSLMGLYAGLNIGLGSVAGGIIGGFGFDNHHGRFTYLMSACVSAVLVLILLIIRQVKSKSSFAVQQEVK